MTVVYRITERATTIEEMWTWPTENVRVKFSGAAIVYEWPVKSAKTPVGE